MCLIPPSARGGYLGGKPGSFNLMDDKMNVRHNTLTNNSHRTLVKLSNHGPFHVLPLIKSSFNDIHRSRTRGASVTHDSSHLSRQIALAGSAQPTDGVVNPSR